MSEARKRPSATFLGTEFNNFLFASIGIDRIGGQLSVVSALARLDMDPWDEAEKLSQLPRDSAAQKLISWMSRFPELASGYDDKTKTAKRLVALLPDPGRGAAGIARDVAAGKLASRHGMLAALCLIALALLVAGQIFWTMRPGVTHASAHSAISQTAGAARSVPGS